MYICTQVRWIHAHASNKIRNKPATHCAFPSLQMLLAIQIPLSAPCFLREIYNEMCKHLDNIHKIDYVLDTVPIHYQEQDT